MTVPSQKQFHRPVLEIVDGAREEVVPSQRIREALITRFSLSGDDLLERVPSGNQTRFDNRMNWAISYLKRAGLLDSPSRSNFLVTRQGHDLLTSSSGDIEASKLMALIETRKQRENVQGGDGASVLGVTTIADVTDVANVDSPDTTPDEQIADLHRELNDRLADDLRPRAMAVASSHTHRKGASIIRRLTLMGVSLVGIPIGMFISS